MRRTSSCGQASESSASLTLTRCCAPSFPSMPKLVSLLYGYPPALGTFEAVKPVVRGRLQFPPSIAMLSPRVRTWASQRHALRVRPAGFREDVTPNVGVG